MKDLLEVRTTNGWLDMATLYVSKIHLHHLENSNKRVVELFARSGPSAHRFGKTLPPEERRVLQSEVTCHGRADVGQLLVAAGLGDVVSFHGSGSMRMGLPAAGGATCTKPFRPAQTKRWWGSRMSCRSRLKAPDETNAASDQPGILEWPIEPVLFVVGRRYPSKPGNESDTQMWRKAERQR
jgi:hypothetical protein